MTEPEHEADQAIQRYAQSEAFDPPYEAYQLRKTGMSWREVAKRTGYSNEINCSIAVKQYAQTAAVRLSAERRQEVLDLELARLDELQYAWWQAAVRGDEKAAGVVLKIIAQRSKLLTLETSDSGSGAQKTILVMGGRDKSYVDQLKEIVNQVEEEESE